MGSAMGHDMEADANEADKLPVPDEVQDAIRTLNLIIQDKTPIALAAGCVSRWDH